MPDLIVGNPALLVVDMQHDFLDPNAGCACIGGPDIIPKIRRVVQSAREAEIPVIFTQELHRPDPRDPRRSLDGGRELDPGSGTSYVAQREAAVPLHCIEGTRGAEIVDGVGVREGDVRIAKRRASCFLGTDLMLLLNAFDVQTLFVTGVASNWCVLWTLGDAYQLDYYVRVVEDCVAGNSEEEHEAALLIMRRLTVGRPIYADEVRSALASRPSQPH